MRKSISYFVLMVPTLYAVSPITQNEPLRPAFYDHALIDQTGNEVLIRANGPRPLDQAVEGIRHQFGWQVDYEDPPYGPHELVDNTDPKWRAEHPYAKGVVRVAGGVFTTTFKLASTAKAASPNVKGEVLTKVVADYNQTSNPGRFTVRDEGKGRLSIVGTALNESDDSQRTINPVLDTKIQLPKGEYRVADAVQQILRLVSQKTGQSIEPGFWPANIVLQTKLVIGGEELSAREFLSQAATSTRFPLVWRLLYDGDTGRYFLSLDLSTPQP